MLMSDSVRLITPAPDRLTTPAPERLITPTSERLITPAPDRLTTPAPDRLITPTSERLTTPTPERLTTTAVDLQPDLATSNNNAKQVHNNSDVRQDLYIKMAEKVSRTLTFSVIRATSI